MDDLGKMITPITVGEVISFVIHTAGPITRASERKIGWEAYERKYMDLKTNPYWKEGFRRDMERWRLWKMCVFDKEDLAPLLGTSHDDGKNRVLKALYESL